jgi:hypothetical protein
MLWARRSIVSFVAASNKDDNVAFGRSRFIGRFCFSKKSDGKQMASLTDFPYFTYSFDSHSGKDAVDTPATWYVPLTSYCNTKTLPETRGPNFRLPPSVVATLCRVRDLECSTNLWSFWCKWLDSCESYQQLPAPSDFSKVATLSESLLETDKDCSTVDECTAKAVAVLNPLTGKVHRPSMEELIREVEWRLEQSKSSSARGMTTIVVAGEGEPTLRLHALMQFIEELRPFNNPSQPIQLRILTNGLLSTTKTLQLLKVCCKNPYVPVEFSVALMTHDSKQYCDLMNPLIPNNLGKDEHDLSDPSPHMAVQQFVHAVVAQQTKHEGTLSIEVTAVDRPDVNTTLTNQFAASLGVTKPVRWRRYYE